MISVETPHFSSMEEALHTLFGSSVKIVRSRRAGGGDSNEARLLWLSDGTRVFLKANTKENAPFFQAEAAGLSAIAGTKAVGTPQVLCTGTEPGRDGYAFLLLEYLEGRRRDDYWEQFGRNLAAMHRAQAAEFVTGGRYGFFMDNYIGMGKQCNTAQESWIGFFRDCRLEPQFERAFGYFDKAGRKSAARVLERAEEILTEPAHPSLLHGDLWSGNVITGRDGHAWLIDPAVYVGHAETDLAMTELFGGFPPAFYRAYQEAAPLEPGYESRRDLYHLYHLLNHLNLFGSAYLPSVMRIVKRYGE